MKKFHLIMEFSLGGIESMLLDILRIQYAAGDRLWLLILHQHYSSELLQEASKYATVILLHGNGRLSLMFAMVRLQLLLWKIRPDIVHAHNPKLASVCLYPSRKIFATVHGMYQNHDTFCRRLMKINRIFAISDAVKNDLVTRYHYQNIVTVQNGINVDSISLRAEFTQLKTLRIVQVSRLEHEKKAQDVLIKALAKLNNDQYQVDFIGCGESEHFLKNLVKKLNQETRIHFLGKVPRNEVYQMLCRYDVLVQPSRNEGFGLTIIEGMAAGLIPLVSAQGGPLEIVGYDEKCGFCFESDNVEACAHALQQILQLSKERLNEMQQAAIRRSRGYSLERMCKEYESYYRKS